MWGKHCVGEVWCVVVAVCGSCNAGEWHCEGDALCGGYDSYHTLIHCVLGSLIFHGIC